ncbi:MAG: SDR family oxidoreductase [Deltaproteobacteria bacterium]|nr:SDR family oxidoreductase [Deltaproteobacteria bacterium]
MSGKVCLVTGANSGIGLVTARELVRLGADVILSCRDERKGDAARAGIRQATGRDVAAILYADFASLDDVRRLAAEVQGIGRPLHVLVNNAGLMLTERRTTREGFEYTFGVNHLAPFLLTELLREHLRKSGEARIVNVASRAHKRAQLDFDDLQSERSFDGWTVYCRSKLCNVLFNLELARRLEGTGVTANSLHPGVVATGFGRESTGLWKTILAIGRPFMTSPEGGARTSIFLASDPSVRGVSGKYFATCRPATPSKAGQSRSDAARLWEISERLVAA